MKKKWLMVLSAIAVVFLLRFFTYTYPERDLAAPPVRCFSKDTPRVDKDGFQIVNPGPGCETLEKINQSYLSTLKPVFMQKCLMCHADSSGQTHPLYVVVPPASWAVAGDIREAKKHMDMTFDFPFQGHGSPVDDLKALQKVTENSSMPPFKYKIMHWQSGLTAQEKKTVLEWVQNSLNQIQNGERK
ncbi:heme-binding domain-containing protein [bacterium]|nr:heme-binding domain-containing protein [bacterium]